MHRERCAPRSDWRSRVESLGFAFHTIDGQVYWREDVRYVFDAREIDVLEAATNELHALCMDAVDRIVRAGRYADLGLDERAASLVERSWWDREPALYGRMDLSYDGTHAPRLLEYNADTPTSLFEASVAQWYWLQDVAPSADQFNSIHEAMVARWAELPKASHVHFAACYENVEDGVTADYLLDTCVQAGHTATTLDIEDIGWSGSDFIDLEDQPISRLFKLYPWEWLLTEPFAEHLKHTQLRRFEPAWKMLPSNKAILPLRRRARIAGRCAVHLPGACAAAGFRQSSCPGRLLGGRCPRGRYRHARGRRPHHPQHELLRAASVRRMRKDSCICRSSSVACARAALACLSANGCSGRRADAMGSPSS